MQQPTIYSRLNEEFCLTPMADRVSSFNWLVRASPDTFKNTGNVQAQQSAY
jgi:hypothetical protein